MKLLSKKPVERAGGGGKTLHAVTKPTPRSGGMELIEEEAQDADVQANLKDTFKEWKQHG